MGLPDVKAFEACKNHEPTGWSTFDFINTCPKYPAGTEVAKWAMQPEYPKEQSRALGELGCGTCPFSELNTDMGKSTRTTLEIATEAKS